MPRRKGNSTHPPTAWVDLMEKHNRELGRVRMLCRCGGQDYRPMVPEAGAHERDPGDDWDPAEVPGVHFEWIQGTEESPVECRERISATVEDLWDTAKRWTRSRGAWCDFKLVGFGHDDEVLFEDGKRCTRAHYTDLGVGDGDDTGDADDPPVDFGESRIYRREHERRMDARMDSFVDRMTEERDKSFATARESLAAAQRAFSSVQLSIEAAPQLISKASDVLKETIEYETSKSKQAREQDSGKLKMRAHALSEMERSRRFGMGVEFGKYVWESTIANVLPMANRIVEVLGNRGITVFPEFKCAQQAMAYLVGSLTSHQLLLLFGEKRKQSPGAFIGVLDQGAQIDNEREALDHIAELVRILRSEKYRGIADPEQQLAARYIIGRLAMYRMGEYGEAKEDDQFEGTV